MSDLLDDHQHQNYSLNNFKDKSRLKFEGMVPHALLHDRVIAEICAALDKANIDYGLENPTIQGNANSGIITVMPQLDVLLHIRAADKIQVDQILDHYEETNAPVEEARKAVKLFLRIILVLVAMMVLFFVLLMV